MATGDLSLFRAKRDITKTAEPSRKTLVKLAKYRVLSSKNTPPRICTTICGSMVNGVFKSSSVTKGPSFDPGNRLGKTGRLGNRTHAIRP
jgi:bifunctional non-homologous end joining protein LigD